jgi:hypothetical protein
MTWLAPTALWIGAAGAAATVAAHLLVQRQPDARALATARFLPEGTITAATVQRVPTNWWWLALRLLAVMLLAVGAAGPIREPTRVPSRTLVLLDGAAADSVQQRVRRSLGETDVLFGGDSAGGGRLSPLLARALRARDSLIRTTDALRVRLISPLGRSFFDAATPQLRAQLPESMSVERVAPHPPAGTPIRARADVRGGPADDILRAAYAQLGPVDAHTRAPVIQRERVLSAADTADARAGAVVLWWPAGDADAGTPVLAAIRTTGATWVAPLTRVARPVRGAPVAHWENGAVAAGESPLGAGCVRDVAIGVPQRGDRALGADAAPLLRSLLGPCSATLDDAGAIADSALTWLAAAPRVRPSAQSPALRSVLAPWLIGAGLAVGVVEALLRIRSRA